MITNLLSVIYQAETFPLLTELGKYGLAGIFIGYLIYVNGKKDKRVNELTNGFQNQMMTVIKENTKVNERLCTLVDERLPKKD